MKIVSISDDTTNIGFMLSGISECLADTTDPKDIIKKLQDPQVGLVLFSTSAYHKYKDEIELFEKRNLKSTPIIMKIPDPSKKDMETDEIDLMIERALGLKKDDHND